MNNSNQNQHNISPHHSIYDNQSPPSHDFTFEIIQQQNQAPSLNYPFDDHIIVNNIINQREETTSQSLWGGIAFIENLLCNTKIIEWNMKKSYRIRKFAFDLPAIPLIVGIKLLLLIMQLVLALIHLYFHQNIMVHLFITATILFGIICVLQNRLIWKVKKLPEKKCLKYLQSVVSLFYIGVLLIYGFSMVGGILYFRDTHFPWIISCYTNLCLFLMTLCFDSIMMVLLAVVYNVVTIIFSIVYYILGYFLFMVIYIFWLVFCTIAYVATCGNFIKPKTHDHSNIRRIKSSYKFKNGIYRNKCCIVCLSDFKENEPIFQMPCNHNHIFHPKCIETWINQNPTCPICRSKIC